MLAAFLEGQIRLFSFVMYRRSALPDGNASESDHLGSERWAREESIEGVDEDRMTFLQDQAFAGIALQTEPGFVFRRRERRTDLRKFLGLEDDAEQGREALSGEVALGDLAPAAEIGIDLLETAVMDRHLRLALGAALDGVYRREVVEHEPAADRPDAAHRKRDPMREVELLLDYAVMRKERHDIDAGDDRLSDDL